MCISYKGDIRVKGDQGGMKIYYDHVDKKWYAIVSFNVKKRIKNSWFRIPLKLNGDLRLGLI